MTPGSRLKVYEGPAHGLFISVKDGPNANLLAFRRMIESQPLLPLMRRLPTGRLQAFGQRALH